MRTRTLTILFSLISIFPLFASAASCPNLSPSTGSGQARNLSFGSRGTDVTQLQQFLISQNLLAAGNATGYFGRLTQAAVKKFQCAQNIVCSGSSSITGYGVVGPRTRVSILKSCNVSQLASQCPIYESPICAPGYHLIPTRPGINGCAPPLTCTVETEPHVSLSSCTPLSLQTQTLECPAGQIGTITQTRTSSCPGPVWSAWSAVSNTCTIARVTFLEIVATAFVHMKNKFWIGGSETGYIAPTTNGILNPPPTDRPKGDLWQAATYLNVLYTDYKHRNNEEAKDMIASEWRHIRATFSDAELTTCGRPNTTQMWGIDDAGWISKMLLQIYDITNDQASLTLAKEIVRCAQRVWWDETWGGGYWYSDMHTEGKSLIQIRLALNALEIYEKTGEVEFLHMFQFSYSWMERNLLRHDGLYWMDFRGGVPYGIGTPPMYVFNDTGSITSIAGDMGMAVAHARYLRMTQDQNYIERIERTVSGILDQLVRNNVFVNDRDPQADGNFVREFVTEVVPVISPALQSRVKSVFQDTAYAIHEQSRTLEGFYGPNFGNAPTIEASPWIRAGFVPESLMVNANSIDFLYGAYILR